MHGSRPFAVSTFGSIDRSGRSYMQSDVRPEGSVSYLDSTKLALEQGTIGDDIDLFREDLHEVEGH